MSFSDQHEVNSADHAEIPRDNPAAGSHAPALITESTGSPAIDPPPLPARRVRLPTPPGYRVLHVLVPERVFNHAKAQAYLSDLKFPDYITRLLQSAGPIVQP